MALPFFYAPDLPTEGFIHLNEETSKHVIQVLRMKQGEQLHLTDGNGKLVRAAIADEHKKKSTVQVIEANFLEQKNRQVSIGISLLKNVSRYEWFLEKATEIGVTDIVPLLCNRTEKQHFRYERMNSILIAAMLQSQQYWLPNLHQPTKFEEAISITQYQTKLIAHCADGPKQNINAISNLSTQIMIGPEGDFTKEEIDSAIHLGFIPVSLGQTRLRTETAGMVAAVKLC